jgi:hypothetical protein
VALFCLLPRWDCGSLLLNQSGAMGLSCFYQGRTVAVFCFYQGGTVGLSTKVRL